MKKLMNFFIAALVEYNKGKDLSKLTVSFMMMNKEELEKSFKEIYKERDLSSTEKGIIILSYLFSIIGASDEELLGKFKLNCFLKTKEYDENKKLSSYLMNWNSSRNDPGVKQYVNEKIEKKILTIKN